MAGAAAPATSAAPRVNATRRVKECFISQSPVFIVNRCGAGGRSGCLDKDPVWSMPGSERIMARRGLDGNPTQVRELMDTRGTAEAADTAAFHAAKRHLRLIMNGGSVDVANTGLNAARHIHRPRNV